MTDDNNETQWKNAKEVLSQLDGNLPNAIAQGNHDCGLRLREPNEAVVESSRPHLKLTEGAAHGHGDPKFP